MLSSHSNGFVFLVYPPYRHTFFYPLKRVRVWSWMQRGGVDCLGEFVYNGFFSDQVRLLGDDKTPPRPRRGFLQKCFSFFRPYLFQGPETVDDILTYLSQVRARHLLSDDLLSIVENSVHIADMAVSEIMVPSAFMKVIDINTPPKEWLPYIVKMQHSRFPVVDGSHDRVVGILLAKDLLRFVWEEEENWLVRDYLRPPVFVPETKPVNVLLSDFRRNRYHMAIVLDEFGGVSGLITIEDVLEQIVGDIDDEFDFDEPSDFLIQDQFGWRVKTSMEMADFAETFGQQFASDDYDTVAGMLMNYAGRVMKRGQTIVIHDLIFRVIQADSRRVYLVHVKHYDPDHTTRT